MDSGFHSKPLEDVFVLMCPVYSQTVSSILPSVVQVSVEFRSLTCLLRWLGSAHTGVVQG